MKFFSFSTTVACLLLSSVAAQSSTRTRAVTPPYTVSHAQTSANASGGVRRAVLPNGLTLVTQIDRTSPRVAFSVLVRAGANDETAQNAGWRRLLAEAMLRATQNSGTSTTIAIRNRQLEELGGRLGASVGDDAIEFWASGESQNATALLDLLLQTVRTPRLSDADVQAARQSLAARRTATSDEVTILATGAIARQLFQGTSGQPLAYGLPLLGTDESLNSSSSTRLRELRNQFFASSRLTVGATGDLDEVNLRSRLATFGTSALLNTTPSTPAAPPVFAPRTPSEPVVVTQTSLIPGDWVFVSYRLAAANDDDAPALSVLAAALGSSPASRLSKRLLAPARVPVTSGENAPGSPTQPSPRSATQPAALQASAALTPRRYGGDLTLFALTGASNAEQLRQAMRDEVRLLRETPLNATELEAARQFSVGDWALGGENLRDRAFRLASDEALGVAQTNAAWTSRLQNVSAEDVQRVARKYLAAEAVVIVRATS
ncbi:MAG TPA: pitrilysin family protein [Abditibacteriaceae bacterium]|nr:pitrilysin family protein [Abditibacteriaceae bacterium]